MPAINRCERIRLAIKGDLPADGRGEIWDERKLMIVARGISLYARQGLFFKSKRLRLFAQQQLAGAIQVFNASPNTVARGKVQRGFGQIAVKDFAGWQHAV